MAGGVNHVFQNVLSFDSQGSLVFSAENKAAAEEEVRLALKLLIIDLCISYLEQTE